MITFDDNGYIYSEGYRVGMFLSGNDVKIPLIINHISASQNALSLVVEGVDIWEKNGIEPDADYVKVLEQAGLR